MSFFIYLATETDLPELTEVMIAALANEPCWQGMKGTWTPQEEYSFTFEMLRSTMANGFKVGGYKCWKVVDENKKIVAWAGLGIPVSSREAEQRGFADIYQIPPGRNRKILEFFGTTIMPAPGRHGFDVTKHFQRQNVMVRPEFQRRGLGRLLTERCNMVADAGKAATYAKAQPEAAGLFVQMGYEILEKIEFNLGDYGAKGGKVAVFVMKREPGAIDQTGRTL